MNRSQRDKAPQLWEKSKVLQAWQGRFVTEADQIKLHEPSDYADSDSKIYLGEINGQHYFVVHKEFEGGHTLREIAANLDEVIGELATTALALTNWHETHVKCPRCGADTKIIQNGWVRQCLVDNTQHFPRTDPAIIVAVTDRNNRLCLGRQAVWPEGRYSNFAGFVEPGESLEDAVLREVEEESGLKVYEIKYLSSQPWPFPNSIMLAFEAVTDNPEDVRPDGEEIVDIKWFSKEELRAAVADGSLNLPPSYSVSGKMIAHWLNG